MSDDDRDNDIENDANYKAINNARERMRRDDITDGFTRLRKVLPAFWGNKPLKPSQPRILKVAVDYIQSMREDNSAHQQHIDNLKSQNRILEDQIRSFEEDKETGNFADILEATHISNSRAGAVSGFDGDSEESSNNSDEPKNGP